MYRIRYASVEDAAVLGKIHSASWKKAYKNIIPDDILNNITPEKRTLDFKKALSKGFEEDALIFNEDHLPLGLICFGKSRDKDLDSSHGEIWGIYLLPEYWNQGVGSKLIHWGISELRRRNYKKAVLWVLEDNIIGRRFYEKNGFIFDGTSKEIIIGKPLIELRYIKNID